jgi:hypothetical protein
MSLSFFACNTAADHTFRVGEPGSPDQFFDDGSDRILVERVAHVAVKTYSPKDEAFLDAGDLEPVLQGQDRAGQIVSPEENLHFPALSFLIGFRARQPDGISPPMLGQVLNPQGGQLGAAQPPTKPSRLNSNKGT